MIKVDHLSKSAGKKAILHDINVELTNGLTCMIGDSGAGKSTFLNILGGLDVPSQGKVGVDFCESDRKIQMTDIREIEDFQRDYVGFVFQESNLISGLSVRENLELSTRICGRKDDSSKIDEVLADFALRNIDDSKAECISGGERLRTAIARAVVKDAPIILADEPTGSLDRENSDRVFQTLKKISAERIVIVVTHNLAMAEKYADRILTMRDGKITDDRCIARGNGTENGGFLEKTETRRNEHDTGGKKSSERKNARGYLRMLTANNIRRFRAKFIAMALAAGIALAAAAIIFSMNYSVGQKTDELNAIYYDADMITFYPYELGEKNITSIIMGGTGTIPDEMLQELSESELFCEVIPVSDAVYSVSGTDLWLDVKLIATDSYFESRLMADGIQGKFPTESKQLILSKTAADALFDGDAIGETILISGDSGAEIEFEIVGINSEKNVDGISYTYIPVDSLSQMVYTELYTSIYFADSVLDESKFMYTEDASGFIETYTDENILYGSESKNDGEIVVSPEIARDLYYSLTGETVDISGSSISNGDENVRSCLDVLLEKDYYIGANDAYECRIVGIHSGASWLLLADADWTEKLTRIPVTHVECYCVDIPTAAGFSKTELATKYSYVSNYEERFENAVSTTELWGTMFLLALAVVILLCIVLIHSYGKVAIDGRLYEVGVLRSLGMRREMVRRMLYSEIYALGFLAWIIGSSCYLIYCFVVNMVLDESYGVMDIVPVIGVLFLATYLICFVTVWKEVKAVLERSVADTIRMKV